MNPRNPGNKKPYPVLWAILSVDKYGKEGLVMLNTPMGPQLAVTGDLGNLEALKALARNGIEEAHSENLQIVVGQYNRVKTESL